ncbi:hypothetical protein [Formosa sp. PL04]|uniref:hypothetical protein n=1 Tax=Formosa sp. PL04 TaxID=3081755 RepID=UPI0029811CBF|nr:hypothetical protein [Formosa sp. PL04]MDW5290933.1 hypothetical protein [Formosa sp. PL04]
MELNYPILIEAADYNDSLEFKVDDGLFYSNVFYSVFAMIYLRLKYKSIGNYIDKLLYTRKEMALNESKDLFNRGMSPVDYQNLKLDFNLQKSVFKHYFLLSSKAKRNSFDEHEVWIKKRLLEDIRTEPDYTRKLLYLVNFKKNLKQTLLRIHILGCYAYEEKPTFDNCFVDLSQKEELIQLLRKHNAIDNRNQLTLGKEYYAVLIYKLKLIGVINYTDRKLIHDLFSKEFGEFSLKTLHRVLQKLEDENLKTTDKLHLKLDHFYYLDELIR